MLAIGFTMASMLDTHCVGCYRHEHFALNQLVKFFLYGLLHGQWYPSQGMYSGWNVFIDDDVVLSWQCA